MGEHRATSVSVLELRVNYLAPIVNLISYCLYFSMDALWENPLDIMSLLIRPGHSESIFYLITVAVIVALLSMGVTAPSGG